MSKFMDVLYRRAPEIYLGMVRFHWRRRRPDFANPVFQACPKDWWPFLLWAWGDQYVKGGGKAQWPGTSLLEDFLMNDIAMRDKEPGPIRLAIESNLLMLERAMAEVGTGKGRDVFQKVLDQIRLNDHRLGALLDDEDILQEAILLIQEVACNPWRDWGIGKSWGVNALANRERYVRNVVQTLSARKYGSNRKGERAKVYLDPSNPVAGKQTDISQDIDSRMRVAELLDELPPKQRQAAELQLEAYQMGVSLEEMARTNGLSPGRVRENLKAVQRKMKT